MGVNFSERKLVKVSLGPMPKNPTSPRNHHHHNHNHDHDDEDTIS